MMSSAKFEYRDLTDPKFVPLRELPPLSQFKKGDVLVVFGELFSRGYANGIVDEALKRGLTVVRSTVGRRDETGKLRALTSEETAAIPQPFINIPMEAGFDLEPCAQDGTTPVDQTKTIKLSEWQNAKLDWSKIESSRQLARERFKKNLSAYTAELKKHIPKSAKVIFAHTMAGGVPRTKVIMPVMNKVFKGTGDRHTASLALLNSDLGRLAAMNFTEVSADTFDVLITGTESLRREIESAGGSVSYLAYGYHGTEVLIDGKFQWQTYTPYFQGWAKMQLEEHARNHWAKGIKSTVFNCPEILTNSSSIFQGVEVSLYPFISALKLVGSSNSRIQGALAACAALLKPETNFTAIQKFLDQYLASALVREHCDFKIWPQHNNLAQMQKMLEASDHLISQHQDEKKLMTAILSEEVFQTTGYVMFHSSHALPAPVVWLGHDILARTSLLI
jgi:hypothetical protein